MASNTVSLNAVYTAPQATKTFEHVIPTTTGTLAAKQAHLSALQSLVPKLQDEINVFLTERMGEDKLQGQFSAQEAKEEANYGEEVIEDDA
ncbi:EKC/KEOPS complex subunit Gon7 [Penicillium bovifimosum]|uniref:EKC/KEOPS complex subunit GON7 n=1 Tax=Penicillium bovifimosum TaxID=126998 RepID=A0A9W9L8K8_9EURO|nr:EKC/KEOPS complex subunit Gon7 [Penicillium bovifimosum]KAJ5144225.1 EKC/KEOPS complex subunit Gon7 [Penicillium bovifimosum]